MRDDQIKHMVDRFLGWRLPENFNPDGGISFKKAINEDRPSWPQKNEPTGTNLFDATQAEEMIRYMIEGTPSIANSTGETMQPHQERVVIEKKELDEKLEKLLAFIGAGSGPIFSKLITEEQERLTTQARIMKEYSDILADRINAF